MPRYRIDRGTTRFQFDDLKTVLAKASSRRSGDELAGVCATSDEERIAARRVLADIPLAHFLDETVIPYETDEVTRLICDSHDRTAFDRLTPTTIGDLRDWLLSPEVDALALAAAAPALTPEMVAAVSKLMRNQELVTVAAKCRVTTSFRTTLGLPGRLGSRLQPNHPSDDPAGVAAAILDGLLYGIGDAVIGINPAGDGIDASVALLDMLDAIRLRLDVPIQSCVLTHVTNTLRAIEAGAPVDLVFQSIAGTEAANRGFGVDLVLLAEARDAALSLGRAGPSGQVMYFETGQGSALSANGHHGVDQQTLEVRAYAVARAFDPLIVNTVVGFIGPEFLYDGKQIIRAGLEDNCCGRLLGLPMGCDVCYTNHAEADQDDMDVLMTLLGLAGTGFLIGVPGSDDVMLNYQSLSFHDILGLRHQLKLRPAPEFELWLERVGLADAQGRLPPEALPTTSARLIQAMAS